MLNTLGGLADVAAYACALVGGALIVSAAHAESHRPAHALRHPGLWAGWLLMTASAALFMRATSPLMLGFIASLSALFAAGVLVAQLARNEAPRRS